VVWVLGVESLLAATADSLLTGLRPLRDLLPGVNSGSLVWALDPNVEAGTGAPPGVVDAVAGDRAVLTLVCYAALFAVISAYALRRRDVT
jgi:ABC-2 type transport system permease protein